MMDLGKSTILTAVVICLMGPSAAAGTEPLAFFKTYCIECHNTETSEGGLNLAELPLNLEQQDNFVRWVKIHDRIAAGEMPPRTQSRPPAAETTEFLSDLHHQLSQADISRRANRGRSTLRRMTRAEYEHTLRDLLEMPGLSVAQDLPADGSAHGFDKNSDALDISHVNMAKYMEAADKALSLAIAIQPQRPTVKTQRISLANPAGFVAHVLMNGDGVLLKNKQIDPDFPASGEQGHIDQGAHERLGSFHNGASVGLFRHEDESFHPYFNEFVAIYPAHYRLRTSLWSFTWDQGRILPSRGTEAARLSIVTLTGDGRGGGHPSSVLTYLDAPSIQEQVHELTTWLNQNDTIGFNTASLAPAANYFKKRRAMEFTGPAIACDYLDIEGPLFDSWPPPSHHVLFGDLPLVEFHPDQHPGVRPPTHPPHRQKMFMGKNSADPVTGIWTIESPNPMADADRLLASFLPRAFRRPVPDDVRQTYLQQVQLRLAAGDCFETAMRWVYRAALCSPDFLYHIEAPGPLDNDALACRLSYFLWNSRPDQPLTELARSGQLRQPDVLHGEVERMLNDARSQRFIEDFLGQWLKLRQIAANDPDRKLYPEFNPYLQDSMVAESRAFFREILDRNLDARTLVQSDFAMLNEKLAVHYGIPGISGSQVRRVTLPPDCPRGGFLTQAAILKVTANGTTTSPVPRGAFVMDRILGRPPEPPPSNVAAVEPDVRGTTTIREQLDKHRSNAGCATCHAQIDPPGFAMESFDVIGGFRSRYRSIGEGLPAERGSIDPFIGLSFKLGPEVDSRGTLPDGRTFQNIQEFQHLIAADPQPLLANLARQLAIYSTGQEITFSDREALNAIVTQTQQKGGGVRTLIHELTQSPLFQSK